MILLINKKLFLLIYDWIIIDATIRILTWYHHQSLLNLHLIQLLLLLKLHITIFIFHICNILLHLILGIIPRRLSIL
jgi:hypothetical protein